MSLPRINVRLIKELFSSYKTWVRNNPDKAAEFETAFKWATYFLSGRINKSMVASEAAYAASDLLVFFNDRIIQSATPSSAATSRLRVWLTVLKYVEVLIEISSHRLWGTKGKWIIVSAVQGLKCALQMVLLLKHKERLVPSPAIKPLKRTLSGPSTSNGEVPSVSSLAFTLKRSGRVIRKVEASPSAGGRAWRPPVVADADNSDESDEELERQALTKQITGEVLYIVKPLAQLATTYRYGPASWKPWLLSLAMDVASLNLLRSIPRRIVTAEEKQEVSRRTVLLLMYLMRSPFYDRHTSDRVSAFLDSMARNVPLFRFISDSAKEYVRFYQSTYSYTWAN